MTEKRRNNNHSWHERLSRTGVLRILRRNVILQAALAILTIVLTIMLVFSLTTAWYTNVVQTGGLGFEAEQWKFDGRVELLCDTNMTASPGDQGIIPLRITNDGDHMVAASATVDQSNLDEAMRKRLYFYVDTPMVRNGEAMDRVYISQKSSYTYTIFPHSDLELSETVQNGPLIRWIWVYDVLGYYVLGQMADGNVTAADYIRPVEYAYDPITTTFSETGQLVTVDGSQPVAEFLEELTATDGYPGKITAEVQPTANGYYPVDVNESGYGVWLYLCTESEIRENTDYDTTIGSDSTKTYTATVLITGANSREDSLPVSTVTELQAALASQTPGIIQLSDNLELNQPLDMSAGTATIDLNGHTLSVGSNVQRLVNLSSGAKLSIQNGTLSGSPDGGSQWAVYMSEAHLTMNRVTLSNVETGVRVEDHLSASGSSSTVYISDCTIQASNYGVRVYGNRDGDTTRTRIVIRSSTVNGEGYAGILYNGSYGGVDTMVSDSTITGLYTAIYHPQKDSTLTIEMSALQGGTGLVVKGGTVTVKDSQVLGNMTAENKKDPSYQVSGWSDTGDGIYLEANYATAEDPVQVTVIGSEVTSQYAYAVRLFDFSSEHASLIVQSGTYTSFGEGNADHFDVIEYMKSYAITDLIAKNNEKTCVVGVEVTP